MCRSLLGWGRHRARLFLKSDGSSLSALANDEDLQSTGAGSLNWPSRWLTGRQSIKGRLHRLVIASVGLALLCSGILSVWHSATTYLTDKRESLLATANIIAGSASSAVAAHDTVLIKNSLRSIGRLPTVAYARIDDVEGQMLAEVGAAARLDSDAALGDPQDENSLYTLLKTRQVQVSAPIIYGGNPVGRVVLISKTTDLPARFLGVLVISLSGALFAVGVGVFIAHRLQRSITRPLGLLADEMGRIAQTQDYSSFVPLHADVETEQLAGSFNVMMGEIRKSSVALSNREAELIFRLSRATEKRDDETGGHIVRMAAICRLVAEGLGMSKSEAEAIHRAAPLHDVGKIAVPDSVMLKPGKLDAAERLEMERHTTHGYEILRDSDSELVALAAEMAWSHHERWDGKGYPRGLKGEQIPLAGRIAAVADVCDALSSERPYKAAWSLDAVRKYLLENSGTHFDPACVQGLLNRWSEVKTLYAAGDAR